ncbi:MAG: alpha/beta hydrolase [Gemmatimonadaceae bacterium]|nr:alpha/beta hydrolase [Gemmatimonadaceae bacterium]
MKDLPAASWRAHVAHWLVAARMRPHAHRPIDPDWVRRQMGRPRFVRRAMARATGAHFELVPPGEGNAAHPEARWPGGEYLSYESTASAHDVARDAVARDAGPTLLYLHGGGFIACSPETHRSLVGALVQRVQGRAWVPSYRLAPEHPYPSALEDALSAYRWLLEVQRLAPERLIVAGDSAGGGLALSVVLAARDAGLPLPAGVVAFCPWADMSASGPSLEENSARCSMFAADTIRRAAPLYAGVNDPRDPLLSPVYADFRDFPPLLLHASTDEVLRDDAMRVAARARASGVQVQERLWRRVPHVWQFLSAVLPEARESVDEAAQFMRTVCAERR